MNKSEIEDMIEHEKENLFEEIVKDLLHDGWKTKNGAIFTKGKESININDLL